MIFLGFYRLQPHAPSFLVPLFTDGRLTYSQSTTDGLAVSGYTHVASDDGNRLIVKNEINVKTPHVGSQVLYAYEYKEGSIAVGTHHEINERLKELLTNSDNLTKSSFGALEIARFLNDPDLIIKYAKRCFDQLSAQSHRLSEKWLLGSDLDESIRKIISQRILESATKIQDNRIRFDCLRVALECIDFLAVEKNMSRSEIISESLNYSSRKYGSSLKNKFISSEYEYIHKHINDHRGNIYNKYIDEFQLIARNEAKQSGEPYDVPYWFLEVEIGRQLGLSRIRASATLRQEDLRLISSVFVGGPRRTGRAVAALFLYSIEEYTGKLFKMIDRLVAMKWEKKDTSAVQRWSHFKQILESEAKNFDAVR